MNWEQTQERYCDIIERLNKQYYSKYQDLIEEFDIGGSHFIHLAANLLQGMYAVGGGLRERWDETKEDSSQIPEYEIKRHKNVRIYIENAKLLNNYFRLITEFPNFREAEINPNGKAYFSDVNEEVFRQPELYIEYANKKLRGPS